MIPQNLPEILRTSSHKYPRRTAIVFGQKKISYRHLYETASAVAGGLTELGVQKGDRVALLLDNCPEFIISYYAILMAGAVAVPINYMFKTEEVKFILQDNQASCLITSRAYVDMAEELRLRLDSLKYVVTSGKIKSGIPDLNQLKKTKSRNLTPAFINPDEPAVILYTSGTTGFPKGAELSHYNLSSNALDSLRAIKVTHRDAFICILPLFHSFAATVCMNLPLLAGSKIVLMKSIRPFKRVIRAIRRNRVTVFVGIPSVYAILKDIKLPVFLRNFFIRFFHSVRVSISGAAALPVETLKGFQRRFGIPLLEGYGLTEASPVVTLNPLKGKRKPGSIGLPLAAHICLRIVDEKGNDLPSGDTGELLVKGPNVMRGYFRKEEASRETIRDGWLYTGDMARFDREGYVYIVGRKKEMINVRGLNVYPREIEEVLYQNPKVREAAVIGIEDPHKGEVPKGFVVLKEGASVSEHEIIQFLRERLAAYKIPRTVEFRTSLPKNTTGKVLKRVLAEEESRKRRA